MGFRCGIVGLPNVGKSTVFNALAHARAEVANYPFCTKDPNKGIVPVPDERLDRLHALFPDKKKVSTVVEFLDIAGLVKNASQGEGLGNQFLSHIREVEAILHVVRCFESGNVSHVYADIDPVRDTGIVETELVLKDLETLTKVMEKVAKQAKTGDKHAKILIEVYERVKQSLNQGVPLRKLSLSVEENQLIKDLEFLTLKPVLYLANVSDKDLPDGGHFVNRLRETVERDGASVLVLCADAEAELGALPEAEREEFAREFGIEGDGLKRLIRAGYDLLDLVTFFTTEGPEVRAWTVRKGTLAPQAAGVIHTDFERGFIRAEVAGCEDVLKMGSLSAARDKGLLRTEGKDYAVRDGDVIHFKI